MSIITCAWPVTTVLVKSQMDKEPIMKQRSLNNQQVKEEKILS